MNDLSARGAALDYLASCAEHAAASGGISEDLSDADEAKICAALLDVASELRTQGDRLKSHQSGDAR